MDGYDWMDSNQTACEGNCYNQLYLSFYKMYHKRVSVEKLAYLEIFLLFSYFFYFLISFIFLFLLFSYFFYFLISFIFYYHLHNLNFDIQLHNDVRVTHWT